jgi:molybdopterin-guanine dinucleotide biosynthesis protein A
MSIAAGSASEVEYQLFLACDLNYIQDETYRELNQQVNEVKRMLNSFIQKLTAQFGLLHGVIGQNPRQRTPMYVLLEFFPLSLCN